MQGTPAGRPIKVSLDSRFDVSGLRFFARSDPDPPADPL